MILPVPNNRDTTNVLVMLIIVTLRNFPFPLRPPPCKLTTGGLCHEIMPEG